MVRTTPFHARTSGLNQTGLWSHWAGHLATETYQASAKFEYQVLRTAAGIFDTSPLYKYRIHGPDAEGFLAGVLARDPRRCRPGQAQYTVWCDDRGFVIQDAVLLRQSSDEFLLTTAEPALAQLDDRVVREAVRIEEVTHDIAALALQGPRSRRILASVAPEIEPLRYFELTPAKLAGSSVTVSRTGFTGDLGYEVWVEAGDALAVWDCVMEASDGLGGIPFGLIALRMARVEAGLLLIDVDFESSRLASNDEHRSTPLELGLGWMVRDSATADRHFVGRDALRAEAEQGTSRWRMRGLVVDWSDHDATYRRAGLDPPKDHLPVHEDRMVYDDDGRRVGYATSSMYSPVLQRHIALARVRPELAVPGTRVHLEVTVNHRYERVAAHVVRLPFYAPDRKTA